MPQDTRPVTIEFKGSATVDVPVDRTGEEAGEYVAAMLEDHNQDLDEVMWVDEVHDDADTDTDDDEPTASE